MPIIKRSTQNGNETKDEKRIKDANTSTVNSNGSVTTTDDTTTIYGHSNVKGIVTAALVVVSVLLLLFILYIAWRMFKCSQRRRKRIQEQTNEENLYSTARLAEPRMRSQEEDSESQMTTGPSPSQSKSSLPSTPTLVESNSALSSLPLKSSFTSSSNASIRTQRLPIQSRPSGLSLNTSISMLTCSEQPDSSTTAMTSPNYDENAYRLSRALQSSPVVSALLNESFDTQAVRRKRRQKREEKEAQDRENKENQNDQECKKEDEAIAKVEEKDERSFDWEHCSFNEVEEQAMWLPELDHSIPHAYHSRSMSEPNQCSENIEDLSNPFIQQRNSMYEHMEPIPSTPTLVRFEDEEVMSSSRSQVDTQKPLLSNPFYQPLASPQSAFLPTSRSRKPPHTAPEYSSQSESFVVISRKRPASAGVTSSQLDHANIYHNRSISSSTPDSECSTASLRRAGAMAIRKNSGGHISGNSETSSIRSTVSRKLKPLDIYPPRSKSNAARSWTTTKTNAKSFMNNSKSNGKNSKDYIELNQTLISSPRTNENSLCVTQECR